MNCRDWEQRVALYSGGDLDAVEARDVERHVAECAGCQLLASGLKQALETLRESHQDVAAEAAFAAVRARVLAEVERERHPWWRRVWPYGAASAAAAVAGMVFWVWPAAPPPPQVAPARVPPAPVTRVHQAPEPPAKAVLRRGLSPRRPRRVPPAPKAEVPSQPHQPETVVVRLLSNDPDVVILWIAETKGE
jgi:hypothetical protein